MTIYLAQPPKERIPGPMPRGRVCAHESCRTLLSTYNEGTRCSRHGGWPPKIIRPGEQERWFEDLMLS